MSDEHKARDERGRRHEMGMSKIRHLLGLYRDLRSRFSTEDTHVRIERIMREPLILALRELTGNGCWVGGEERLIAEVRARAARAAGESEDLPSSMLNLHEQIAVAREPFHEADLEVLDHRELSGDCLEYWREEVTYLPGASRWGPEVPMLVCRRSRVPKVEYYWALGKIMKRWDPFSLSLLLFTESDYAFGPAGRWIGPTFGLVNILREHYPTFDEVSYDLAALFNPPDVRGCLPDYRDIHEYGRLFELLPSGDYLPFHERMLASVPVLAEVGIRIRRVDRIEDPRGKAQADLSLTEWIVEALPWDNPDIL